MNKTTIQPATSFAGERINELNAKPNKSYEDKCELGILKSLHSQKDLPKKYEKWLIGLGRATNIVRQDFLSKFIYKDED
jgi:hypothetical protein